MLPNSLSYVADKQFSKLKRMMYITDTGLETGSVEDINVSAISYAGFDQQKLQHIWKVELASTANNWIADPDGKLKVTLSGTTYHDGTWTINNIDMANNYVYIVNNNVDRDKVQSTAAGTATIAGIIPVWQDTRDGTLIKNNDAKVIAIQYDEAGYFLLEINRQLAPYVQLQVVVNSAGAGDTLQVDLHTSIDLVHWDSLNDSSGNALVNVQVPTSGSCTATACSKTFWIDNIADKAFLRIYVHDVESSATYYLLVR